MRFVLIQVVLVVGISVVAIRLMRGRGARAVALRRIALLGFALIAIASVLFPTTWQRIAEAVGVGRGADMVLYALVVAFLGSTATTYLRFRDMEVRYTRLARRIALREAPAIPSRTPPPPAS